MCYYICQVRVRNVSNSGSLSAAFLFSVWQISIKYLGLIDLGHGHSCSLAVPLYAKPFRINIYKNASNSRL